MLAKRLARHGLAVSGAALAAVLSGEVASAGMPASVLPATIKAVTSVAAGQAAAGVVSGTVAALTEGVLKAMLVNKLKTAMAVLLAVVVTVGIGTGLLGYGTAVGQQNDGKKAATVAPQKEVARSDKEKQNDAPGKLILKVTANLEAIARSDGGDDLITLTFARRVMDKGSKVASSQLANIPVAKDAKIRIADKEAKFADLRPKTVVQVHVGADEHGGIVIVEIQEIRKKRP